MKCSNHPEKDAIAVCSFCGRGLCSDCAEEIQGRIYCKENGCKIWASRSFETSRKRAGFLLVVGVILIIVALVLNFIPPFDFFQSLDLPTISLYIFIAGVVITLYSRHLVDVQGGKR
ncbi:MAG: hypothetical protein J7M18_06115 [Candidatus Eremiobacteraeota bacterium]|nr:hypothetical protein [Candidatus Eremiobacteraeota bacterium]